VTGGARKPALGRPTTVAVHDDGNVTWDVIRPEKADEIAVAL
jgi:hypothetical protein